MMCGNGMFRAVSCRTVLARTGSPGPWTAIRIRRPRWVRDSVRGDHPRSPASRAASACSPLGQAGVDGRELGADAGQVTRHVAEQQLNPAGPEPDLPRRCCRRQGRHLPALGAGEPAEVKPQLVAGDGGDRQVQRGLICRVRRSGWPACGTDGTRPHPRAGPGRRSRTCPVGCVLAKLRQALQSRSVSMPQARQWSQLRSRDARGRRLRLLPAAGGTLTRAARNVRRAGAGSPARRPQPPGHRRLPAGRGGSCPARGSAGHRARSRAPRR